MYKYIIASCLALSSIKAALPTEYVRDFFRNHTPTEIDSFIKKDPGKELPISRYVSCCLSASHPTPYETYSNDPTIQRGDTTPSFDELLHKMVMHIYPRINLEQCLIMPAATVDRPPCQPCCLLLITTLLPPLTPI